MRAGPIMSHPAPGGPERTRGAARFEGACSAVLREAPFQGVYVSPLWEVPVPEGFAAWKRSVLRRLEGGGAEHWGHLFLVEAPGPGEFSLGELHDAPELSHLRSLPVEGPWALEPGPPSVWLLLRARDERTRERLVAFAEALRTVWPKS